MANRIAGITVEIGGDTTKLSTALKTVNTEIKSTQTALNDVNRLLKLDPGNTELLTQKHKLLAQAVSETKEKLAQLKVAAEQANEKLANGEISQQDRLDIMFDKMSDSDKKQFFQNFIKSIEIYPDASADERILRHITFKFPVSYDAEDEGFLLCKQNDVETMVLLEKEA